jgi:hypothetical protein
MPAASAVATAACSTCCSLVPEPVELVPEDASPEDDRPDLLPLPDRPPDLAEPQALMLAE